MGRAAVSAPTATDIDLAGLPTPRLQRMAAAGLRVLDCQRVLAKSETNVVAELLKGPGEFFEWDHYPNGDVYDWESHAQYYYHAHPPERRANVWGAEHGHFHTFLRPKGMPAGVRPLPLADDAPPAGDNDALSHLVAISMDRAGQAIRLFTTNRWVTGETWYAAADVVRMLDRFDIDQALPSWPANVWISGMLQLFRPDIEALLAARDARLADWISCHPGEDAYEDRDLEITSIKDISVADRAAALDAALAARGLSAAAG